MHAFVFVCLTAVTLGVPGVYSQNLTVTPVVPTATTNKVDATTAKACVTARRDAGSCVDRERCDYGTAHIDFTLYVPSGYIKQCTDDKVCCPPDFVSSPETGNLVTKESYNEYDFDDDD